MAPPFSVASGAAIVRQDGPRLNRSRRVPGCSDPPPRDTLAAAPNVVGRRRVVAIEPREEFITVGGIKTHVLIGGRGDPLVVLHGAGGNRGWRRWMAAVAERFTVHAPTHPGFGVSGSADWMESIDDLARFYLWFLDELGL